jgi:hypothetical protein
MELKTAAAANTLSGNDEVCGFAGLRLPQLGPPSDRASVLFLLYLKTEENLASEAL